MAYNVENLKARIRIDPTVASSTITIWEVSGLNVEIDYFQN